MARAKLLLMLSWVLAVCAAGADAAPVRWADKECELRLLIVVPVRSGVLAQRPVVVRWARVPNR